MLIPPVRDAAGPLADRFTCRCDHERSVHQHYRAGTDCGKCDCRRFAWRPAPLRRPRTFKVRPGDRPA